MSDILLYAIFFLTLAIAALLLLALANLRRARTQKPPGWNDLTAMRAEIAAAASRIMELSRDQELRLDRMRQAMEEQSRQTWAVSQEKLDAVRHTLETRLSAIQGENAGRIDAMRALLEEKLTVNDARLEAIRQTLEQRLSAIARENQEKLEAMRQTVDEKLTGTLNRRLGESFSLVNERLEAVYKGLGEMQQLAVGVGDLKNVLSNVKTRGTWGEVQLGAILEQILAPSQYERNAQVKPRSLQRVDYAVVMPGRDGDGPVLFPIDSKFPMENYQRLTTARQAGDKPAADEAVKGLEGDLRRQATAIRDKYIAPPHTTDFACMFLPVEGLYAEALQIDGLSEWLLTNCRVVITGPTTLAALLNSLQMGFRTLAIEKRSSEVWSLLGAVKTEFGKFAGILEKTRKNLSQAANSISAAAQRTRVIERRLQGVEVMEQEGARAMLGMPGDGWADAGDAEWDDGTYPDEPGEGA